MSTEEWFAFLGPVLSCQNFWAGMLFHRQLVKCDIGPQTLMKIKGIEVKIQGKYGEKVKKKKFEVRKIVFKQVTLP